MSICSIISSSTRCSTSLTRLPRVEKKAVGFITGCNCQKVSLWLMRTEGKREAHLPDLAQTLERVRNLREGSLTRSVASIVGRVEKAIGLVQTVHEEVALNGLLARMVSWSASPEGSPQEIRTMSFSRQSLPIRLVVSSACSTSASPSLVCPLLDRRQSRSTSVLIQSVSLANCTPMAGTVERTAECRTGTVAR